MPAEPEPQETGVPPTTVRLITLAEAARALGVSRKWLRVHKASLPFVRELAPRVLRVDARAMERWVERRKAD